ncbi:hypothetical protein GOP47_0023505 [Adiantum capillus-veneris]|uniref:Uncharacterized protein n=1 Tax=Adiantum capillus-veneris TaxID=13818 RepID=A0A9D4Z4L1_ADICA|nr:hypothetical protein GOP47_0023505 [Adiantum capillus-veneris]
MCPPLIGPQGDTLPPPFWNLWRSFLSDARESRDGSSYALASLLHASAVSDSGRLACSPSPTSARCAMFCPWSLIAFGSGSLLRDGFLWSSHFRLWSEMGLNRRVLRLGLLGVFESCISGQCLLCVWLVYVPSLVRVLLSLQYFVFVIRGTQTEVSLCTLRGGVQSMEIDEPRKNASLAYTLHPKSGISKRECVRIDVSAQVGCSKAQKAKMAIVKIERYDLSDITPRFAIEGCVLNNYGTYKLSDPKIVKFFKIEGSAIKTKNKADGGTSPFSLYLDATSIVTCIGSFPIRLSFYPKTKIRFFLDEAASAGLGFAKSYLSMFAFVVIKSENFEIYANSTRGDLLVVDGSAPKDRATQASAI